MSPEYTFTFRMFRPSTNSWVTVVKKTMAALGPELAAQQIAKVLISEYPGWELKNAEYTRTKA